VKKHGVVGGDNGVRERVGGIHRALITVVEEPGKFRNVLVAIASTSIRTTECSTGSGRHRRRGDPCID